MELMQALAECPNDCIPAFHRQIIIPLGYSGLNYGTVVTVMRNFDENVNLLRYGCIVGGACGTQEQCAAKTA